VFLWWAGEVGLRNMICGKLELLVRDNAGTQIEKDEALSSRPINRGL